MIFKKAFFNSGKQISQSSPCESKNALQRAFESKLWNTGDRVAHWRSLLVASQLFSSSLEAWPFWSFIAFVLLLSPKKGKATTSDWWQQLFSSQVRKRSRCNYWEQLSSFFNHHMGAKQCLQLEVVSCSLASINNSNQQLQLLCTPLHRRNSAAVVINQQNLFILFFFSS